MGHLWIETQIAPLPKLVLAAAKSLDQGTAVFDDMPASVQRRDCDANIETREFDFKPVAEACITDAAERINLDIAGKERDSLIEVWRSSAYIASLEISGHENSKSVLNNDASYRKEQ
jgi:hypothetical protein